MEREYVRMEKVVTYVSRTFQSIRRHNRFLMMLVPLLFILGLIGWVFFWMGSEASFEVRSKVESIASLAKIVLGKGE